MFLSQPPHFEVGFTAVVVAFPSGIWRVLLTSMAHLSYNDLVIHSYRFSNTLYHDVLSSTYLDQ
jgi:hypothetical protein